MIIRKITYATLPSSKNTWHRTVQRNTANIANALPTSTHAPLNAIKSIPNSMDTIVASREPSQSSAVFLTFPGIVFQFSPEDASQSPTTVSVRTVPPISSGNRPPKAREKKKRKRNLTLYPMLKSHKSRQNGPMVLCRERKLDPRFRFAAARLYAS